jgi:hypothetical protein
LSKLSYWFLFLLIAVTTLGRQFLGNWVLIVVFGGMAVLGIVVTTLLEYRKARITQLLDRQPPDAQDGSLVWLEDWADRPEIEDRLDRRGPRVALRGDREKFEHETHHLTLCRWTFVLTAALVLGFSYMGLFHPPADPVEWRYLVALIIGFGFSLAYLPSQMRMYAERIEITDEALEVMRSSGRRDVIPWADIQSVHTSAIRSMLVIRSSGTTVRIPHIIVGYGRLANLIASRLPSGVAWRAV